MFEDILTPEEVYELALRYIDPEDCIPLLHPGDLFALAHREIPDNAVLDDREGWEFAGYALLQKYVSDPKQKPRGKWVQMYYLSLETFPPQQVQLQLQPPHIAKGSFQDPTRTIETRILPIGLTAPQKIDSPEEKTPPQDAQILQFPTRS